MVEVSQKRRCPHSYSTLQFLDLRCAFSSPTVCFSLSARRRDPRPKKRRGGKREEERTPHPTRAPGPSRGTQTPTKEPRGPEQETPNPRGPQGQEEDPDAGTQASDSRSPRVARLGEAFATDPKKYGLNGAIKIEHIHIHVKNQTLI